jgi:hypothetical protein
LLIFLSRLPSVSDEVYVFILDKQISTISSRKLALSYQAIVFRVDSIVPAINWRCKAAFRMQGVSNNPVHGNTKPSLAGKIELALKIYTANCGIFNYTKKRGLIPVVEKRVRNLWRLWQ